MPSARRFRPPWTAEETDACFIVRDAHGQQVAYAFELRRFAIWIRKPVPHQWACTHRCSTRQAFCSSSHALTGEAAMPIKSAKDNISGTACMRMITPFGHWMC
jgi:hypothetical protein